MDSTRAREAAFIGWTMGVNHSTKGTETVNAINNLALITGNIGRAGAAPFSITGQCNAMGTREAGFASIMPGYRKFESAADRAELAALWNVPVERIPAAARPGLSRHHRSGARRSRSARCGSSPPIPIVSFPNLTALQQALEGLEFLVVQDGYHPTPTTELADLVLPAAIWGEKEGTYTNSERRVSKVESRGRRRPARRAPTSTSFSSSPARSACATSSSRAGPSRRDAFEEWRRVSAGRLCDYSGMTYEAHRAARRRAVAVSRRAPRRRRDSASLRRGRLPDRRWPGAI